MNKQHSLSNERRVLMSFGLNCVYKISYTFSTNEGDREYSDDDLERVEIFRIYEDGFTFRLVHTTLGRGLFQDNDFGCNQEVEKFRTSVSFDSFGDAKEFLEVQTSDMREKKQFMFYEELQ